ncbi:serine/threonine protein kinase, partial [Streptomyces sp. NPDC002690]
GRRLAASEAIRRRPRVASAVAGSIAFVVAVYLGTVIFAPDSGSAVTPGTGASQGVVTPQGEGSPAPAASDTQDTGQRDSDGEDGDDGGDDD